jgi:hypothetical protein
MAREGVPLIVIQRQLGHTNLGITSIYLQGIDNAEIIDTVPRPARPDGPRSQLAARLNAAKTGGAKLGSRRRSSSKALVTEPRSGLLPLPIATATPRELPPIARARRACLENAAPDEKIRRHYARPADYGPVRVMARGPSGCCHFHPTGCTPACMGAYAPDATAPAEWDFCWSSLKRKSRLVRQQPLLGG